MMANLRSFMVVPPIPSEGIMPPLTKTSCE
jgi:hypothetical protein